ncbi:acyltransferase family protein [Paracoccus chinensis]|uniref:Peptidoglycan/LPS O-acetylase OafA/YrhL, contains acyltransferase and SGNH-hydrolase domains n=1 Tax=Paracoccus chinensis TaxID=525640 RepID=A0A1G9JVX3_9RHOB|nr:acyltransferase family protein [Paracoccus chinensis]SDL41689.1 Peptidoglycan/LPS O-acetylase OafA/YrhL, contains acyltransferase and SGNH-hydrolase domains [Paracoccus chinensis]
MNYRPEVDGLRAVAVVPVILFHAKVAGFSGGFVGVDVFFVISGYLISGIILADLEAGRFSILRFYERRARRILPALFLTLFACTIAAWFWFLPRDLADFSQSVAATTLFLSNILFLQEAGYFDVESELKPLLHTWSLAIEEQYYILFPPVVALIWHRARSLLPSAIVLMLLASFFASVWLTRTAPQSAYFLLTTRGWELLMGVVAMLILRRQAPHASVGRLHDALAFVGLGLVLWSVAAFDHRTQFPGPFALVPTLGTVLVLLCARPGTWMQRVLSWPLLVLIGLVSYSAYLFHQPMLAFLRYMIPAEPALAVRLALVLAVFPLAWLSWKYVEMPFRAGQGVSRRAVFTGATAGILGFVALGAVGHHRDGYVRFDLSPEAIATLRSLERSGLEECRDLTDCLSPPLRPEDVLLIGDSNAFHFSAPLAEALADQGRRLVSLTRGGCFPSDRTIRVNRSAEFNAECRAYYAQLFDYLRGDLQKPRTVLLSAAWAAYYYGSDYFAQNTAQQTPFANARVTLLDSPPRPESERRAEITREILSLLGLLSERFEHVCVVGPLPFLTNNFRGGIPAVLAGIQGVSRDDFLNETDELLASFAADTLPSRVRVLYPHEQICSSGVCDVQLEGRYLYSDIVHVSDFGARTVFADIFDGNPDCLGSGGE